MRKSKEQSVFVPETEQPYPIPDNWQWVRMGALVNLYRGVSYKKEDAHSSKKENDVLILRGGNIAEGFVDIEADSVYVNQVLVDKDQFIKNNDVIIVGSTGSKKVIGRAGIVDKDYEDVAFGAFLILARPNGKAHSPYVNYYFLSDTYRNRIRRMANGVNINNIRAEYITELAIPIPPLAEQHRIVEHIESLFSKLDEANEKIQTLSGFNDIRNSTVGTIDIMKKAILARAFRGELGTNDPSEPPVHIPALQEESQ